ncbi:MAG: pyridoxal-phosphate dependent enzyme [Sulfolobales archaeon]
MTRELLEKIERGYVCVLCGYFEKKYKYTYVDRCPVCGGFMIPVINEIPRPVESQGVWRWSEGLLTPDLSTKITLHEANTPMIKSNKIHRKFKIKNLFFKDESRNPTGLYIDRGSAVLVSLFKSTGVDTFTVVSTGDLAFSMGVYGKRAQKMRINVILPSNTLPSKILRIGLIASQISVYDSYEQALRFVDFYYRVRMKIHKRYFVLSSNPYLMNGYQTILFEILRDLGKAPDMIVVPFGDGSLMTSLVVLVERLGLRTKIVGVRSNVSSPVFSEIRIEKPLLREQLEFLMKDSRHEIIEVSDKLIRESINSLSREEGLPIDPIGASTLAGLDSMRPYSLGLENVVLVFSGGGLLSDPVVMKSVIGDLRTDEISLGFMKEKILEILIGEGSLPAYRIWKNLREKYGVIVSLRTVYNHLRDLERMGLVKRSTVYDEDLEKTRAVYVVTEEAFRFLLR